MRMSIPINPERAVISGLPPRGIPGKPYEVCGCCLRRAFEKTGYPITAECIPDGTLTATYEHETTSRTGMYTLNVPDNPFTKHQCGQCTN